MAIEASKVLTQNKGTYQFLDSIDRVNFDLIHEDSPIALTRSSTKSKRIGLHKFVTFIRCRPISHDHEAL